MKKVYKYVMLIAILFVTLCMNSVTAMEDTSSLVGVSPIKPDYLYEDTIGPYGLTTPTKKWTPNDGDCAVEGKTVNTALYSNYYFTGVKSMAVILSKNTLGVTLELWEVGGKKAISTVFVPRITAEEEEKGTYKTGNFANLSTSKKYYIKFMAPTTFKGFVRLYA